MSKFIAIPVGQGDAFYLELDGFSILIDGGRNRCAFSSMFRFATKTDGVNVIACTHNDADHVNGILGFLEAGLRCDELWLPGRWLSVLPDVLKPFIKVFDELADNIAHTDSFSKTGELQSDLSPFEAYSEYGCDHMDNDPDPEEEPSVVVGGWPESCLEMLEQAEPWEVFPHGLGLLDLKHRLFSPHSYYRRLDPANVEFLWSAIDAAARIRAIAIEAFHRGISVRWFEFDVVRPSGGIAVLQPMNAREIAKVRPSISSLLMRLSLSVSNKESLVFWSPPSKNRQGVLFTADSDLANVNLPHLDHAIVTAPHHGSEANRNAYKAVLAAASNGSSITWVRSDGKYRNRPGNTYLGLVSLRLCTLCRCLGGSSTAKQIVRLHSRNGVWRRHQGTRFCSCR